MGTEEKKPEEEKVETAEKEEEAVVGNEDKEEEKKKGEKDGGLKKTEEEGEGEGGEEEEKKDEPPPPPPEEIIMKIYMHCEGCARKVQRSLRGFKGVEGVMTDCRTHKVIVKGQVAAADPLKVVERLQKKTGRRVELLTPIPPKPEKKEEKKEEEPKPEKKEEPRLIAVFLKVHMHCEACSQEIKKRIQKMKGVDSVDPDLKASLVKVVGAFDPTKLVEYVYRRTFKHAVIVKVEQETKSDDKGKDDEKNKEEKKVDVEVVDVDGKKEAGDEKDDKGGDVKPKEGEIGGEKDTKEELVFDESMASAMKFSELKKNEFYYYYPQPRYYVESTAYPPQIFSDENPNACSVM